MPLSALKAVSLVPHLKGCGYDKERLKLDYRFGSGQVPVAAFADTPYDARSVCIAVVDALSEPESLVVESRPLGAPVVFACHADALQWWKQTTQKPILVDKVERRQIPAFFDSHRKDFSPNNIFEGKTRRRLPGQVQLDFVDAGLMPFIERTDGERLSRAVETAFRAIEGALKHKLQSETDAQNAIKATFWLLAAKALHDKEVDGFRNLNLLDIEEVFARVGRHYDVPDGVPPDGKAWREATAGAADRLGRLESLRNLSTESLAHVYENALVTPEVRKANGTHCTPGPLVDYMIWQLWPWIEALPTERRHIFEPACGHAAFLVGALRVLRQWSDIDDPAKRHDYLKKHLHGIEYDAFAVEVGRLSLTLADIPHGNRWDLRHSDMFARGALEAGASSCGVLLANPPFERFAAREKVRYAAAGVQPKTHSKALEMLRRTIPCLREGACFGVVVPQGFLRSKEAATIRRTILSDFELSEVDVFEDKLFANAEHEAAVLLGRRQKRASISGKFWFRRVRNPGVDAFRDRLAFSSEDRVDVSRFASDESADLWLPELDALWRHLLTYPMLGDIATVAKGLDHKGKSLPKGCWTVHDPPEPGDPRGYANVGEDLEICRTPKVVGLNLEPRAVQSYRAGRPYGSPQVLLNYARVGREAWRLKATLDERGLALTSRLIAVRPTMPGPTARYLWALLNSPIANAFAYSQTFKRDIQVGMMKHMPVPRWSSSRALRIEEVAIRYRMLATSKAPLFDREATQEGIRGALKAMDAAVLQAYDLPPRLERQLLDLFTGVSRKGVGCEFSGYYPPGFTSYLPLHHILSESFERARADVTSDRFKPGESEHVRQALIAAAAGKGEE